MMQSEFHFETDWLNRWRQTAPDQCAIFDADKGVRISYKTLFQQAVHLANGLRELGVRKGDRVALLAKNGVEHIQLFFAASRLGAIFVPLNFRLAARELEVILADCNPQLLVTSSEFLQIAQDFHQKSLCAALLSLSEVEARLQTLPATSGEATFEFASENLLLYTSGTTGAPKGVIITHEMMFWNSVNTGLALNLSQNDTSIHFHPFFHTSGWNVLLTPMLHRGATTVLISKFCPERVLQLVAQEKISILIGLPTMMEMMARHVLYSSTSFESVRFAIVGGEPMPIPLIESWQARGVAIRQGFGLTEFGPNVFSLHQRDAIRKAGSIGYPNFYVHTKLVDENDNEVARGEIGELLLKGPMCTKGYWRNDKATQGAIRDGWLRTGDLMRCDDEGYYYVVGRKKDMYISGGENVYPAEVEAFLRTHAAIAEVAVIGVPDAKWGEVGKAFVVTKKNEALSAETLSAFCNGSLARYKIPKIFEFMDELPKGDSGKVLKKALR